MESVKDPILFTEQMIAKDPNNRNLSKASIGNLKKTLKFLGDEKRIKELENLEKQIHN